MAGRSRKPDVPHADDRPGVDSCLGRAHAVPQPSPVGWPFPADWRKVKPQPLRERLAAMEDAPF